MNVTSDVLGSIAPDVLAAVRRVELRARRAVREGLGGRWTSAVHGAGIEFAEVREYVPGDDARTIDWNVTARRGRLHVKRFDEEREQTIFFLADVSASCRIEGRARSWPDAAAEAMALLGLAAAEAGDRVGAVFFARGCERVIAPRHGETALLALLAQWLAHAPTQRATDLDATLREFLRWRTRPCLAVVLSDLHESASPATWTELARRHDLVVLALRPPWFDGLPRGGLLRIEDPEGGGRFLLDLDDARTRRELELRLDDERRECARVLRAAGADLVELSLERALVPPLVAWTRRRVLERAR